MHGRREHRAGVARARAAGHLSHTDAHGTRACTLVCRCAYVCIEGPYPHALGFHDCDRALGQVHEGHVTRLGLHELRAHVPALVDGIGVWVVMHMLCAGGGGCGLCVSGDRPRTQRTRE